MFIVIKNEDLKSIIYDNFFATVRIFNVVVSINVDPSMSNGEITSK